MLKCKNCSGEIRPDNGLWEIKMINKVPTQDTYKNKKGMFVAMPGDRVHKGGAISFMVLQFCCNAPKS